MTPARRGAIGLALLVAGCTADMAPPLEWRVVAGEGLDPDAVVAIEARITEGNCGLADRRARELGIPDTEAGLAVDDELVCPTDRIGLLNLRSNQ